MTKLMTSDLEIKVLDKGYVKLTDWVGSDLTPLVAARMSTANPTGMDKAKDDRLRDYLWQHDHSSVFEMADMTLEMKLPLFVLRQLERHRTLDLPVETLATVSRKYMSRNEFSGRYSIMPEEFYIPSQDRISGNNMSNKQDSGEPLSPLLQEEAIGVISKATQVAYHRYQELLDIGVANETARMVLPLNIYTKIRLKGSLLSWLKMLEKRLPQGVQWETRQYAIAISHFVRDLWPKSWEVFSNHSLNGVRLSADEVAAVRKMVSSYIAKITADPTHTLEVSSKLLEKLKVDTKPASG